IRGGERPDHGSSALDRVASEIHGQDRSGRYSPASVHIWKRRASSLLGGAALSKKEVNNPMVMVIILGGLLLIVLLIVGLIVTSSRERPLVEERLGHSLCTQSSSADVGAGYSIMQAMEAVSKEMPPPINDEFRRVIQEMQIGIPMETALANLLRRIPSDDLDFVVTAINVQREVGGNLSEILDTISFTIRERVKGNGEIRVLTS